jgi:hypothetical protein
MAAEGLVHGADLVIDPEIVGSRRDLLFQKAERERPVAFTAVTARLEARETWLRMGFKAGRDSPISRRAPS